MNIHSPKLIVRPNYLDLEMPLAALVISFPSPIFVKRLLKIEGNLLQISQYI